MDELRSRAIAAATALVKNTKKYVILPKMMMSPTTKPPDPKTPKPKTKFTPPPPPPPKAPPPKPKKPDNYPPCIESDSGGGGDTGSSVAVVKKSRAMKFPYTHTAKFVQMPWLYYFKKNWHYRYFVFSVILCLPVFKYIQDGMNSPTNVAKWEALQAKDREEQAAHHH